MRITMCGTASGGNTLSAGANILLEAGGQRLLLDCGHSSVNRLMQALGARSNTLDALFFSHLHFDHVVGLPEMFCRFELERRPWPRIFGPRDSAAYVSDATAVARTLASNPDRPRADAPLVEEGGPGIEITVGGTRVTSVEVPHVPHLQCLARRFEWEGGSLVYSGDTTDAPEIMTPLAAGAGVLVHECYTGEALERTVADLPEQVKQVARSTIAATHSRVESAASIARDADVGTLILTHLLGAEDPQHLHDVAGAIFKGRVIVARDGLVVEA